MKEVDTENSGRPPMSELYSDQSYNPYLREGEKMILKTVQESVSVEGFVVFFFCEGFFDFFLEFWETSFKFS